MTREEHMARCVEVLGEPFEEVHKWLDEFFADPRYGTRHRCKRHHLRGMKEAGRLFGGKQAEAAAFLHILDDLKLEGWAPNQHEFPRDEEHFKKIGLW